MALGPRLDLRQSQHLVMTPQLRQAIKLLQSSNLEVSAFIEEELERNPLLERDERPVAGPDAGRSTDPLPVASEPADAASAAASDALSVAVSSEAVSDDEQPARTSVATAKAVTTFHLYDFCIISLSMIFRSTS